MANVGAVISSIRNIMRQDRGISGDAQRLEQLGWMLFLKIIDDKDQELEITKDDYVSVIPERFQWRTWATDSEGITGDALLEFVDSNSEANRGLFASLRNLSNSNNPKRASIVKEVFEGSNNYMKSGYEMRKVINKLNEIDFNNSDDKHIFGDIYESILVELRDAGNKGEYYTPRAVTQLMTQMIDPKLGEKVLDPAAGTGGFLTAAIDHVRDHYVNTVKDEHVLQKSITGWEFKPVAYVLGLTNLILHEIDIPDYHYMDSLKKEFNSIGAKDRVDVILANPPFGASIADGVETNFPATYRCKESADLFVILMLQLLKPKGRLAIVLPDGSITGGGVKARIRKKLLTDCNLHTIIRLPQTTFFPATVSTNLLFFDKGSSTKEIWYYEHKLPIGQKSYSKTKPIKFHEFEPIINWWNNRKENNKAWKVNVNDLKDWDLDIKNPIVEKKDIGDPKKLFKSFKHQDTNFRETLNSIFKDLDVLRNSPLNEITKNYSHLFKDITVTKQLRIKILQRALKGQLTLMWRKQVSINETSIELLKRIKLEREKLINEKLIKKEKPFPSVAKEDVPYELPQEWVWCRLGDLIHLKSGQDLTKSEYNETNKGIPYLTGASHIYNNKINVSRWTETPKSISTYGDLLLTCKGTIGKLIINTIGDIHIARQLMAISPIGNIETDYIKYFLKFFTEDLLKRAKSLIPGISRNDILHILFPLPPIEEQRAIVNIVNSLMEKCLTLEDIVLKQEDNSNMLMKATLNDAFERSSR